MLIRGASNRFKWACFSLLVIFAFPIIYNIIPKYNEVPALAASQRGNTGQLPETARPMPLTPQQRWKTRVAESGNCVRRPAVPTWDDYFDLVEHHERCSTMEKFGGAKYLCMDGDMAPRQNTCTVVSFGISNEWNFDDAMAMWGCEVYSFDPTIGLEDHLRGDKIHFYSLGLSGKKGTITSKKAQVPVDSYRGVLERVGLVNRTIDYLKIDIEGFEIDFFENVLYKDTDALQHVKQMGVEIHVLDQDVQFRNKLWNIYDRLECLGFRKVSSERNTYPPTAYVYKNRPVSCCYELVWINEAFL